MNRFHTNLLRRTTLAFVAITGAAFLPSVSGQTTTIPAGAIRLETTSGATTSTECPYGTMAVTPNGGIRITCAGAITVGGTTQPPPENCVTATPTTFSLSTEGGELAGGGTPGNNLRIVRHGSCEKAYRIGYRVEGDACGSPAGSTTVRYLDFAAGSTNPITIPLTMGQSGSSCRVSIGVNGPTQAPKIATYTLQTGNPPPPPPSGTCPTGTEQQSETFGVISSRNLWLSSPDGSKVIVAQMPSLPSSYTTIGLHTSATGFTMTPSSGTVRYSISKTPCQISTDYTDACNQAPGVTIWTTSWAPNPSTTYPNKAVANASGVCWAPQSEGPWYLNARYEFGGVCRDGVATCGMLWMYY